jgi:hypothetical protein
MKKNGKIISKIKKMKQSEELSEWLKKRLWGKFMKMNIKARKVIYNNNFELYCKKFLIHTHS